ncbi:uncharacterized protein LOC123693680, partial [Colias croceus]|uniref:uncharacterized protein LOC123693680 n=1 Tax=Colias crocea TaxID=72248 RepID=UPI001E27BE4C
MSQHHVTGNKKNNVTDAMCSKKIPFTTSERELIVALVRDRPIIEDKRTNSKNIELKKQAWEDLTGEFSLHVKEVELCKGPKRKDCCVISAKMSTDEVNLLYDIVIKKDVIPTRGKVVATINGQPLIRLQMKNPCDHLFMKPLFQAILNVTQQCVFVKGTYHLSINIENVAQKYYGGMFLYGNLTFKSMFYNDECNFSCTVIQVEFKPKK